ncbi:acyl carrier protein [Prevotella sp.]|uniref:acyl carrier protein n=1 Tax=Prevotella sp. TaxID=59823 RepID=UPI002F936CB0
MERNDVLTALNGIFSVVLNKENLQLSEQMSTDDIDNWDSLTNMTIISEIERLWQVHFKLRDIIRMRNIGDMVDTIISKSQN